MPMVWRISPGVPQILPRDFQPGPFRIAEIHFLPSHLEDGVHVPRLERPLDRTHQRPRREPFDQSRGADQIRLDAACIAIFFSPNFFDAPDLFSIGVVDLGANKELDIRVHYSSSSDPPPGSRSMM